jgi:hypothetical protein
MLVRMKLVVARMSQGPGGPGRAPGRATDPIVVGQDARIQPRFSRTLFVPIAGKIRLALRDSNPMDAKAKAEILHGVIRKFGAGGRDITSEEWGQFVAAQNDGFRTGPEIGERVPDFSLPDQHGKNRTLKDLSGPDGLLLVFSRSADW